MDELITAQKRAGTYSGMMTLFRKIVSAVVLLLVGGMLGAAACQAPETVRCLRTPPPVMNAWPA
ncbi:MAG: hypothetical protein AB1767_00015 [Bacillota bacterium]